MSAVVKDLIDHRTKLLAMKAALISDLHGQTYYNGWMDHDIKECDRLIELAIKTPTDQHREG